MKKEHKYIIYGLVDPGNGELRYIGQSSSGLTRPKMHAMPSMLKKTSTFVSCWIKGLKKLNLKPEIIIIEKCEKDTLNDNEVFYIEYFRFLGCNLCNHLSGGSSNYEYDVVTRKKIGEASKGRKPWLGRNHTEETKKLLSEQRMGKNSPWYGKKHTSETKLKMSRNNAKKRTIIDQFGNIYESQAQAAKLLNIEVSGIEKQLCGKFKAIKGYQFKYLENE